MRLSSTSLLPKVISGTGVSRLALPTMKEMMYIGSAYSLQGVFIQLVSTQACCAFNAVKNGEKTVELNQFAP